MTRPQISVGILDLYNNAPNEGMRCILALLKKMSENQDYELTWTNYNVRALNEIPDFSHDIYISTGGPGSPLPDAEATWEKPYFNFIDELFAYNSRPGYPKKHAFFICHSFQLLCRHLKVAVIEKRKSTAFGIFPVHLTDEGRDEICFKGLPDPFYVVDSRDWQVIQPDAVMMEKLNVKLLAIEKERPHVPYERAAMAMRFTPEIIGTQFHPEADATGMLHYMMTEEKKTIVVKHHGQAKYDEMLEHLNDEDKIELTQSVIMPMFLRNAISAAMQTVKI